MTTPIEILDEMIKNPFNSFEWQYDLLKEAKERIKNECSTEVSQPNGLWIPVSERLPSSAWMEWEEDLEIIFIEGWKIIVWKYRNSISWDTPLFFWNNWMYTNTVTHWMKLPIPPNQ